jgi:hypothetical protein
MSWTRTHTHYALAALLLALAGTWLVFNTEWVDVNVPPELHGPAKTDPLYAFKRFADQLGVELTAPDNLDRLPPPGATLVLSSWSWDLFPERGLALRRWVEAGGHLVLPSYQHYGPELAWTTIRTVPPPAPRKPAASHAASAPSDDDEDDDDDSREHAEGDAATDRTAAPPSPPRPRPDGPRRPPIMPPRAKAPACPGVTEPAQVRPAFETHRRYSSCTTMSSIGMLRSTSSALWAADAARGGHVILRVAVGKGTVTAANSPLPVFGATLLENDEALLLAATLRLARGQQLWLVTEEKRPPLLATLWHGGAPAILLGAIALALALWRAGVRFGPCMAPPAAARRSVGEQIRGTAAFIAHRGGRALHRAQLRALDTLARSRVSGYDALIVGERAAALAPLVGIDVHTLARAMNPGLSKHLPSTLALLETARRRLLLNPAAASGSKPNPDAARTA